MGGRLPAACAAPCSCARRHLGQGGGTSAKAAGVVRGANPCAALIGNAYWQPWRGGARLSMSAPRVSGQQKAAAGANFEEPLWHWSGLAHGRPACAPPGGPVSALDLLAGPAAPGAGRFVGKNAARLTRAHPQLFVPACRAPPALRGARLRAQSIAAPASARARAARPPPGGAGITRRGPVDPGRRWTAGLFPAPLSRLPFRPRSAPWRAEGCTDRSQGAGSCSTRPGSSTSR